MFFPGLSRRFRVSRVTAELTPPLNTLAILYGYVLQARIAQFGTTLRGERIEFMTPRRVEIQVNQIFDDWCRDFYRHDWKFLMDHNRFYCALLCDENPETRGTCTVY